MDQRLRRQQKQQQPPPPRIVVWLCFFLPLVCKSSGGPEGDPAEEIISCKAPSASPGSRRLRRRHVDRCGRQSAKRRLGPPRPPPFLASRFFSFCFTSPPSFRLRVCVCVSPSSYYFSTLLPGIRPRDPPPPRSSVLLLLLLLLLLLVFLRLLLPFLSPHAHVHSFPGAASR